MKRLFLAALCLTVLLSASLLWGCGECDHDFGEWEPSPAATCTESGTEKRVCAECDFEETRETEALGHTEVITEAIAPTCTTPGFTQGKRCETCKIILQPSEILPESGHIEVIDEAVEPTCTDAGSTQGSHCSVCNEAIVPAEVLPALGHNYTETVTQIESCKGDGIYNYLCENCGDAYTETITYPSYSATEVHDMIKGSVAEITTYGKNGDGLALGSGFVYNGSIITNYHVIEGAYSAQVSLNGKTYNATTVVAYDKDLDLAIIGIDAGGDRLQSLKICTNDHEVGATVYAIGSSKGFTDTFSNGIISNANRQFDGVYYVQHTAAISSGNSGGPLVNQFCEVIGVNTLTIIDSQNLNMAVNISQLSDLTKENLSFPEFYKRERDPISVLGEYVVAYGEYAPEYDEYYISFGGSYNGSSVSDAYYYYSPSNTIQFWYSLNDTYYISLDIDEISNRYEWTYYYEDYYITGYIIPSAYYPTSSLSDTENNFTDYSLYSNNLQIANMLMRELCRSLTDDLADFGFSAADFGFVNFGNTDIIPEPQPPVSTGSIVGKYFVYSVTVDGITVSGDEIASTPVAGTYLELKTDGTFFMTFGDEISGTYDAEAKTLTAEGESLPFSIYGDELTIVVDTVSVTFKK